LSEGMVAGAVDAPVFAAAEGFVSRGAVGVIAEAGGGAAAVVQAGPAGGVEAWVGVVEGGLVGECDCTVGRGTGSQELCAHAVAVVLRALREGFAWSSAATPPSAAVTDPQVRELIEVAQGLPRRRLASLVAGYAATDRRLRTRLLVEAGELGPLTETEAAGLRRSLGGVAAEATSGRWGLRDVVAAGQAIVGELEIVAERPAGMPALLVVEYAAGVWDGLAAHLLDDGEHRDGLAEEIGQRLRRVHLNLCEQLRPDPDELAERVDRIVAAAEVTSCLDAPCDDLALHE
jgi:hypothetical protein